MLPHHRRPLPLGPAAAAAALALLLALPASCRQAGAETLHRAEVADLVIELTDEPCAPELAAAATNLKRRATWRKGGPSGEFFEGCWAGSPFGVIVFYFADRTVAVVPVNAFRPVEKN